MKKKLLMILFTALLISRSSDLYIENAKASELTEQTTETTVTPTTETTVTPTTETTVTPTPTITPAVPAPVVSMISIYQMPAKVNYTRGESLDLTDLIVQAFYVDGTTNFVTDYEVMGYNSEQIGSQTIILYYQNQMAYFPIMVLPSKASGITVTGYSTSYFTLSWDADPSASRYEIYYLNDYTGTYDLYTFAYSNMLNFYYPPGTVESFKICTVENLLGVEYKSEMSDIFTAATSPETVNGLVVTATGTNSVTMSWNPAAGATGYLIYRSAATEDNYILCGTTDAFTTFYMNNKLISGKSYKYKVYAYAYSDAYVGAVSNIIDTSTNAAKMKIKYKQGDQKVRLSWGKIGGATSYDIYISDQIGGYMLLTTFAGNTTVNYIAEGLTTGETYSFYAIARREYNGLWYDSPASDLITIEMLEIEPTSTMGILFPTEQDFLNSWVYNSLPFFKKYVSYENSYAIPGLITTNVGGFSSTTMCPQGLTFAGDYLLVSSYDLIAEENSVIYVLDKTTKELLTTLILPSKPHVGGLAFDGYNVWVTNGSKVSSIALFDIDMAVAQGLPYEYVTYTSVCPVNIVTSFVTYYDNKLWIGSYNELQTTNMHSYLIENIDAVPTLVKVDTIVMPTRVQGVAFSSKGTMFISRSCQLYKGLRGYMRQIDVYKPQFSMAVNGIIPLGKLINTVNMPGMNEGIAIDGDYLYVNFESAAFEKSSYKMDRISAFKLVNVVKKKG